MKAKYGIIAGLCLATLLSIERLHWYHNGRFTPSKLISHLSPQLSPPPLEIDSLLNQSFRFLGKGCTCFVFLGEDGKTILKLFNHSHLVFKSYLFQIALPGFTDALRIGKLLTKQHKATRKLQDFFFNSCRLAYDELKDETGLIYLCLQPNPHFSKPVTLIDAWGIHRKIDLSKTEFALQHKAELLFDYLKKLHLEKRNLEIERILDAFLSTIRCRCLKGIGDSDPNVEINFGCIDGKVIEFDLGAYFSNPRLLQPLQMARELFFSSYGLQRWLEKHSPEHLDYFLSRIKKMTECEDDFGMKQNAESLRR